jgi:IS605 OrfB family transposase
VKRTIALKLNGTADHVLALEELQATFAVARNAIVAIAVEARTTNRVKLHHLAYYQIRARFPALGAQMTCNAIASVARSLKAHRANGRPWQTIVFRADGAVHVDARTFRLIGEAVSLFTMVGRQRISLRVGAFQRNYLQRGRVREAELVSRRGRWFLNVALDLPDLAAYGKAGILGVDLGENVAAATSGGSLYGGGPLKNSRDRFLALRRRLQGKGSQSAKQLLRKVSGRESRHVRHVNHAISAKIVAEALERGCGTIAMENLRTIRDRIKAGKRMRTRLHRWAWRQLQRFVAYKAQALGIAIAYVDPAYTSQICSSCDQRGTRQRHRFSCKPCGIFAHSDRNAARNIAKIAARALTATGDVMRPYVAA